MRTSFVVTVGLLGVVGCSNSTVGNPPTPAADASADAAPDAPAVNLDGIPAAIAAHPLSSGALARLAGLDGAVDVEYDAMGWPHIYATSLRDAAYVQGYVMARDRMPQMEMLRRVASGTLAERFGVASSGLVATDISARVLGLRHAAEAMWAATAPGRDRTLLEGYARGVNRFLQDVRDGNATTPEGTELVIDERTPEWTPVDSLVIGRYQSYSLSYDANDDVDNGALIDRVTAVVEHAPATSPALVARRGMLTDVLRWAQESPTAVVPDFFPRPAGMMQTFRARTRRPTLPQRVHADAANFLRLSKEIAEFWGDETRGSNNWVVHPSASMTGHPLLANDPHLSLTSPAIWWGNHLTVTRGPDAVDVAGTTFPGIPGVIIGFTPDVAWGVTTAGYDVTDVYQETITPGVGGAPDTVRFNGMQVPIQIREEPINDGAGGVYMARLEIVPHHGPIIPTIVNNRIVPRTGTTALSIKWTGHQPTTELTAFLSLAYAHTAAEAKTAVNAFGVGAQNFVIADRAGAVEYTSHAIIPVRPAAALAWTPMNPTGTNPCAVLPGTGEAEWMGVVPNDRIPQATASATRPFIASANNDQAGVTFDNNPFDAPNYLGCYYPPGWRAERITTRLRALGTRVTLDDMKAIQGDHHVIAGERFRPFLMQAMQRLELEWTTPGSQRDLATLAVALRPRQALLRDAASRLMAWSFEGEDGSQQAATEAQRRDSIATTLFHTWLGRVFALAFDDEVGALNMGAATNVGFNRLRTALFLLESPMQAATRDATTGQSVLWDDLRTADASETRDYVLVKALDESLTALTTALHSADVNTWLWGPIHTVQFESIIPGPGSVLSIPPDGDAMFPRGFPRPGGIDVVDAAGGSLNPNNFSYGSGPSQRFVVEMTPTGPRAFNVIPGGQSMDLHSRHFRDGADLWRVNQYHPVPIAEAEIIAASERHLRFAP